MHFTLTFTLQTRTELKTIHLTSNIYKSFNEVTCTQNKSYNTTSLLWMAPQVPLPAPSDQRLRNSEQQHEVFPNLQMNQRLSMVSEILQCDLDSSLDKQNTLELAPVLRSPPTLVPHCWGTLSCCMRRSCWFPPMKCSIDNIFYSIHIRILPNGHRRQFNIHSRWFNLI